MKKQAVLAFSGGLDTSFCVPYLIEKGYEVVSLLVTFFLLRLFERVGCQNRLETLGAFTRLGRMGFVHNHVCIIPFG